MHAIRFPSILALLAIVLASISPLTVSATLSTYNWVWVSGDSAGGYIVLDSEHPSTISSGFFATPIGAINLSSVSIQPGPVIDAFLIANALYGLIDFSPVTVSGIPLQHWRATDILGFPPNQYPVSFEGLGYWSDGAAPITPLPDASSTFCLLGVSVVGLCFVRRLVRSNGLAHDL